jgi:hypothetical protein
VAAHILPVKFSSIKASEKLNGIQIEFTNLTESDIDYYEVERSFDSQTFLAIKRLVPAKNDYGSASYTWIDADAVAGRNVYRIKAVEATGKVVYSNMTSLVSGVKSNNINVYTQGNLMKLQINNLPAGRYQFRIFNAAGQQVSIESINHGGGSFSQSSTMNNLKAGIYIFDVKGRIHMQRKFAAW